MSYASGFKGFGWTENQRGDERLPHCPGIALAGTIDTAAILARFLPKTPLFGKPVSQTASGVSSVAAQEAQQEKRLGQIGVAVSPLRPGGKAKFDGQLLDVVTQGELVELEQRVKIIGHSGSDAVVEAMASPSAPSPASRDVPV